MEPGSGLHLVVAVEQQGPAPAALHEAAHVAVELLLQPAAGDDPQQVLGQRQALEVGHRARLGERQARGVAQREDVVPPLYAQRARLRRHKAELVPEARGRHEWRAAVVRDAHQQVVGEGAAVLCTEDAGVAVDPGDVEPLLDGDTLALEEPAQNGGGLRVRPDVVLRRGEDELDPVADPPQGEELVRQEEELERRRRPLDRRLGEAHHQPSLLEVPQSIAQGERSGHGVGLVNGLAPVPLGSGGLLGMDPEPLARARRS